VTDDELRAIVREVIARRARPGSEVAPDTALPLGHASHLLLPLARGGDGDGACLIEPAVRCNHCGYCLSYGH
jgi:hypothetical protein